MQFYLHIGGQERGPYSIDDVRRMAAGGGIQPADLAWREGMAEWAPLSSLEEFAGAFAGTKTTPRLRPKSRSRTLAVSAIAVIVMVVAAVIGWFSWSGSKEGTPSVAATAESTTAADAELPQTLADLDRWYAHPDFEQNAASLFQDGFKSIRLTAAETNSASLPMLGKAKMPDLDAPLTPAMKAALAGLLQRNREALELFRLASQRTASRYSVDLTRGYAASMPHLPNARKASRLLVLAALADADRRQEPAALTNVLTALALARSLESEPVLVSQLIRSACAIFSKTALEQVLNRLPLTEESLHQLQAAFGSAAEREARGDSYYRALVGQVIEVRAIGELSPDQLALMFRTSRSPQEASKPLVRVAEDRTFALESLQQYLTQFQQPFPQRLKADELLAARRAEATAQSFAVSSFYLTAEVAKRAASLLAWLRIAHTAIVLERFRLNNQGQIPASLSELVPTHLAAMPQDPFDGQTLRYRPEGKGYKIYSVGSDLQDDGGTATVTNRGDLAFQLLAVPKRP